MLKNIGIFRALDVRFAHAEFAAAFKYLKPYFAANMTSEIEEFLTTEKVGNINLQLHPKYFVDPVFPLLKKTDFTPWMEFNPEILDSFVKDIDVYEIYEPYFFYSSQIANLAKKKNVPLLTEIWTSFPSHPSLFTPPYNFLVDTVVRKTDIFVLRSQRALSYLERFNVPSNKKIVLYHGVNLKRFTPAKKAEEKIRILFVGALAAHKGLDDLLTVFPKLVEKYPKQIELTICGIGPLKKTVEHMALRWPIHYLGLVSNRELPDIYRSAAIYCQPSKDYFLFGIKGGEEFAGYTFMEALASGLPIVSTYCGGIPEVVGDENTLLQQHDRQALFNALDSYIANKNLRYETGLKNRVRAEKFFDLSKQVKALEKIIKDKLS